MSPDQKPEPILVADSTALTRLVEALSAEPVLALDTESNSFHVYRERVCLLQLSTRAQDWVVDPLAVDVRPLGQVLCDGRDTVLHGADYDVRCLKREYGWRLPRLFDTMAAARRLGRPGLGLSALVEAHFGVRLSKTFQRSDWGRRPLSRDQLAYASLDTRYLLPLYDLLAGFWDAFKVRVPECNLVHCPSYWAPPELGCSLSEDEAGCMSTRMFEEFCLPGLVDLAERFGGMFVHCCADADHQHGVIQMDVMTTSRR